MSLFGKDATSFSHLNTFRTHCIYNIYFNMVHSGIVTRCPLELKLRKLNNGSGWTAVISYNEVRETFHDPAQVESYVRRGEAVYQAKYHY